MVRGDSPNSRTRATRHCSGWKHCKGVVVVVKRYSNLVEMVFALCATSGFACLLDCRKKQGHQHVEDCNDHQQLNQCEPLRNRPWDMSRTRSLERKEWTKGISRAGTSHFFADGNNLTGNVSERDLTISPRLQSGSNLLRHWNRFNLKNNKKSHLAAIQPTAAERLKLPEACSTKSQC